MTTSHRTSGFDETDLTNLVDALVEAVDTDREDAVDRLRSALTPFGGTHLFNTELRFNGRSSDRIWTVLAEGTR